MCLQVTPASADRGTFYKVSLALAQGVSSHLYTYLGVMQTLASFVARAGLLCGSELRLESAGVYLLQLTAVGASPLNAAVANATCSRLASP